MPISKMRHDVRMVENRHGLRLVLKSPPLVVIGQDVGLEYLQGDESIEAQLPGLVDNSHATSAQFLDQLVVAEVVHSGSGLHADVVTPRLSDRSKSLRCIRVGGPARSTTEGPRLALHPLLEQTGGAETLRSVQWHLFAATSGIVDARPCAASRTARYLFAHVTCTRARPEPYREVRIHVLMASKSHRISSSTVGRVVERGGDLLLEDRAIAFLEPVHGCVDGTLRRAELGGQFGRRHRALALR